MKNIVKTKVNLSTIKVGDTVEYKGEILTVGKNCIRYCSFMGYSFRGDASSKTITLIQFKVPTIKSGMVLR